MKKLYLLGGAAFILCVSLIITAPMMAANNSKPQADMVRVIVGYDGNTNIQAIQSIEAAGGHVTATYSLVPVVAASIPKSSMTTLQNTVGVSFVDVQAVFHVSSSVPAAQPDNVAADTHLDTSEVVPYGVNNVHAPQVWDMGYKGQGVKIAVLDTGLAWDHPDAPTHIDKAHSYDFVYEDPIPNDVEGHGTHVTGTIAAPQNGIGVVGVAPEATIIMMKVCGDTYDEGCAFEDLLQATEAAIMDGVDIITMSLGGPVSQGGVPFDPTSIQAGMEQHIQWKFLLDMAYSNGILITAAAGNDGTGASDLYPAGFDSVMSIGAVDSNNVLASFSSFGGHQEVVAPGVDVLSTVPVGTGFETVLQELSPNTADFSALAMSYSGIGDVSGQLYDAGLGTPADFTSDASGKIALIERGSYYFSFKAQNAIDAGAIGVIVYNNAPGNFGGTLGDYLPGGENVPVVSISQEDGQALLADMANGPVQAHLGIIPSNYDMYSGTSMATPHVAGVAALLMSANPNLSNVEVRNLLDGTATHLGTPGERNAYYGYGLVDAYAAVLAGLP